MSMKMCKLDLMDANNEVILTRNRMYEVVEDADKSYIVLNDGKTLYLRHRALKNTLYKYFYSKEEFRILQLNKLV